MGVFLAIGARYCVKRLQILTQNVEGSRKRAKSFSRYYGQAYRPFRRKICRFDKGILPGKGLTCRIKCDKFSVIKGIDEDMTVFQDSQRRSPCGERLL